MERKVTWKLSDRLISYFASSIYGEDFDVIAVREALQNSVDAKAKNFRLHIIDDRNVIIENDGEVMPLSVIENQLFTLGESTKTERKDTGFFGVGECAIISPCEKWKIETGNLVIEDFIVKDNQPYFNGTKHTLTFRKPLRTWKVSPFLENHNVKCKVLMQRTWGTEQIKPQNFAKCRKFDIPNGQFIWKKSGEGLTVIRVNGVPQKRETRYDTCGTWIIDLNTSEILTVNREQIRDEETKKSVDAISEHIRKISEHVSGDKAETWINVNASFPLIRKKGINLRRSADSDPLRKIYECLEVVDDFYHTELTKISASIEWNHKIGLAYCQKETLAFVKEDIIYVNVNDRNVNPPTTFILQLIDDYCHELAHITGRYQDHEKTATSLRYIAYHSPEIYETLRKKLRYGKNE